MNTHIYVYIYIYIYTYIFSKNRRAFGPSAWQTTSPFILFVVLLFNSTAREAPLDPRSQKSPPWRATRAPFFGAPRLDFLVHREGVKK